MGKLTNLLKSALIDEPYEEMARDSEKKQSKKQNTATQSKSMQEYYKERFKEIEQLQRELDKVKYAKKPDGCFDIPKYVNMYVYSHLLNYISTSTHLCPNRWCYDKEDAVQYVNWSMYKNNILTVEKETVISSQEKKFQYRFDWWRRSRFYYFDLDAERRALGKTPDEFWIDYTGLANNEPDLAYRAKIPFTANDTFKESIGLFKSITLFNIEWTNTNGKIYQDAAREIIPGTTNISRDNLYMFTKLYEDGYLAYSEYIAWVYTDGVSIVSFWQYDNEHPDWHPLYAPFDSDGEKVPPENQFLITNYATRKIKNAPHRRKFHDEYMHTVPVSFDEFKNYIDNDLVYEDSQVRYLKHAALIARMLPCTKMTMGDPYAPKALERVEFVKSWSETYQRIAAILVAYLPIDHDNLLESMTCKGGILDCIDTLAKEHNMPKEMKFKIQQLVLSVSDIEDPVKDPFCRYRISDSKNLKELCEFRNRFYAMQLGIQRSIAVNADYHVMVTPTDFDCKRADYNYAIKKAINSDKFEAKTVNGGKRMTGKSLYVNDFEKDGYVEIRRPAQFKNASCEIPDNTAKWLTISAKDADDFIDKLNTVLPDLIRYGADIRIASKENAFQTELSFNKDSKYSGHLIMIKQSCWDVNGFLDAHPELLLDTGVPAANSVHLGGCLYGHYDIFGNSEIDSEFTLSTFINACETHPCNKDADYLKESYAEFFTKVNKCNRDVRNRKKDKFDHSIWNFYATNRHEFEKYRSDDGYMHEKLGSLTDVTVAQEIEYAKQHDPFSFCKSVLDLSDYEPDIE